MEVVMAKYKKLPSFGVFRKNIKTITLSFDPTQISGATVFFTAKPDFDDVPTDTSAIITKDVTDTSSDVDGQVVVVLSKADTDKIPTDYVYDIKVVKGTVVATTLGIGKMTIWPVVTLRG